MSHHSRAASSHAGDPDPSRASAAVRAAQTRRRNRARAVARIRARSAIEDRAIAVCPSAFVQAMLPHRDRYVSNPDGTPTTIPTGHLGADGEPETLRLLAPDYAATNGAFTLTIRAGTRRGPSLLHPRLSRGVPTGGLARLLLIFLVTEAKKRKSPIIPLGSTLADLCESLDITPSGGDRGRLRYLFDQLLRLVTCSAAFEWESGTGYGQHGREHYRGEQLLLVEAYELWWERAAATALSGEPPPLDGPTVARGTITLGNGLWTVCQRDCFPLDWRKVQALRGYPAALDLYAFLTYRLAALQTRGHSEVALSYDQLHAQLGSHYATDETGHLTSRGKKDFGYNLRRALRRVQVLWPALDVITPRGRFVIRSTGPDVSRQR